MEINSGPQKTLGAFPHVRQSHLALLGALITFAILLSLLWQFSAIYQESLMSEQKSQVEMQLLAYGNTLTNHISLDIAHLQGVETFVQANPSKYHLFDNFDTFSFGLYSGAKNIRSIQLFPVSNEVYVYPGLDNSSFMGNSYSDLINDEVSKVHVDVQRAVQTRQVAIGGPYELEDGETVLVAMHAIYIDDSLWGLAFIIIDMQSLLQNTGLYETSENINIALRDGSGQMYFGSSDTFLMQPELYNIGLPEGRLELAAVPVEGWSASIKDPLSIFQKGGFVVALLFSLLVYVLLSHYSALKFKVIERTASLNESEKRYQQLFDNSSDALFLIDADAAILDANMVALNYYGYTGDEVVEKSLSDLFSLDEQEASTFYMNNLLDHNIRFRSVHMRKDGTEFPVEISSSLIKGETIRSGVLVAARDITERKRAEEALKRSEEMFSRLFNTVPDSIILTSTDEKIINVNESFEKNTGFDKDFVVGKTTLDVGLWSDSVQRAEYVSMLKEIGSVRNFETTLKTNSDESEYVLVSGDRVRIGDENYLLTVFRDITDLKKTEKELMKTESLLSEVSSIAHIGGWEFDVSSGEGTWTLEVAFIHDLDSADNTNRDFGLSFYTPDSTSLIENAIKDAIEKRKPYDLELELISAKGVRKWVRSLGRPVIEDDVVIKITGSMQDITDRKKAEEEIYELNQELEQRVIERTEQLETANKELESFTYSVSHDLRAPLRAIDGFSRILTEDYEDVFDDEAKRLFGVIRSNTKKMDKLITDLLSLSRIGRNEMNLVDIDMAAMVRSIIVDMVVHKDEKNFVVAVPDIPHAYADSTLIRQLWTNLLSNAVKYSMKNEEIKIEVGVYTEDGMNVYFVKDNGVGFDQKYSEKLFGIFQRLHSEKDFEGTGVGLAIVQRIVHRHGGRIWAEGKVNQGATFYFSLPLRENDYVCGE